MSDLYPEEKAKLARILGMKPSEVIAAAEIPDADPPALVVETHDGVRMRLVSEDGVTFAMSRWDGQMPGDDTGDDELGDDELGDDDSDEDGEGDGETVVVGEPGPELTFPEAVPEGSADVVLAWVGDDKDRAARALAAEQDRDKPRSTLVGQLERIAQA